MAHPTFTQNAKQRVPIPCTPKKKNISDSKAREWVGERERESIISPLQSIDVQNSLEVQYDLKH